MPRGCFKIQNCLSGHGSELEAIAVLKVDICRLISVAFSSPDWARETNLGSEACFFATEIRDLIKEIPKVAGTDPGDILIRESADLTPTTEVCNPAGDGLPINPNELRILLFWTSEKTTIVEESGEFCF